MLLLLLVIQILQQTLTLFVFENPPSPLSRFAMQSELLLVWVAADDKCCVLYSIVACWLLLFSSWTTLDGKDNDCTQSSSPRERDRVLVEKGCNLIFSNDLITISGEFSFSPQSLYF